MENSRYKFRVWTGKYMDIDVWVNSNGAYGEPDKKHNTPHIEINKYDDDAIVMQFTGLLDKNGKEIYEGDVIKWDDMSKEKYWRFAVVEMNPDILFNCKFINEVNGIKNSANHIFRFGKFIYKDTHNHIEIIGNIYENPNLIN